MPTDCTRGIASPGPVGCPTAWPSRSRPSRCSARTGCARASGEIEGSGLWELQGEGDTTRVRYTWDVKLATAWMRMVAPLAAPVFRWNHDGVMRSGGQGLASHLGVRRLGVQ